MNVTNFPSNEYTNPSFLASSNDLAFPNRTRQNIWSTSQSYLPPERNSQYSAQNTKLNKGGLDKTASSTINKRCLIITLIVVIAVLIVGAAIGLGLTYNYYWKPRQVPKPCPNACKTNSYCVSKPQLPVVRFILI